MGSPSLPPLALWGGAGTTGDKAEGSPLLDAATFRFPAAEQQGQFLIRPRLHQVAHNKFGSDASEWECAGQLGKYAWGEIYFRKPNNCICGMWLFLQ